LLQRLRARALAHDIPIAAVLELTNRCNLRCRHCYIHPDPAADSELTLAEYRTLFDQMAAAGTLFLTITGGEPFVRRDLFDILAAAREREFSFTLYTNGTLLTPQSADRLRELCPQKIEISLLGATAATHDGLTQAPGSWAKALAGARLLLDRGLRVELKTTWMRTNLGEADAIQALAKDYGASFRSAYLVIHRRDGHRAEDLEVTEEQLREAARRALAKAGPRAKPPPPPTLTEEQKAASSPCGAGQSSCRVDARGLVYPCAALDILLGDIRRTPFAEIWHGNPALAELRALRITHLTKCRDCRLLLRCSRCAGLARMETGSLLEPSCQSCRVAWAMEGVFEERRCDLQ
jgi:radical SAM protein with 4Fe4S-binding SPASM domain